MPATVVRRAGLTIALLAALSAAQGPEVSAAAASVVAPASTQQPSLFPGSAAAPSTTTVPCRAAAQFVALAGEGAVCQSANHHRVMRLRSGRILRVAPPDAISSLGSAGTTGAPAPGSTPVVPTVQASQCVNPSSSQPHVELFYAHFLGQTDRVATAATDIAQQFHDVDNNYLSYDATHYFGTGGAHLYVECDPSQNLVVHDIQLSTVQAVTTFDTIVSDMQLAGFCQPDSSTPTCTRGGRPVHYWIWTDGNPTVYAGQSTVQDDDRSLASNVVNQSDEYSVNYGFTDANLGALYFAHENGHAMGAVQLSAPHSTGGWHCTDGLDVMCYNDGAASGSQYTSNVCTLAPNGTRPFDCGWNDYFNPSPAAGSYLATHWNIAGPQDVWLLGQQGTTTTAMTTSTASALAGQPVTMTAAVSDGGILPAAATGSVTFYDGSVNLGAVPLDSSAHASLTTSTLALGSHTFTASYSGSPAYAGSVTTAAAELTVAADGSQTTVRVSPALVIIGQPATLSASATAVAPGTGHPTGTMTFFDDTTVVGSAAADSAGSASISMTWATAGTRIISATYSGDGSFAGSSSPPTSILVHAQAPPRFVARGVGDPQVAVTPDGTQQLVFWRGADGFLAEAWYTNSWNGPVEFPQFGRLSSRPAVAVTKDGSTQLVFWQGPSGHLMEAWYSGSWNGPVDWTATWGGSGVLTSAPSLVTMPSGQQSVFWRGIDGHLWEAWYTGTWNGPVDWAGLGTLASDPSVAITPDGASQLVFWQGVDGNLTEVWYTGFWNGPVEWAGLGKIASAPSVAVTPDGSTQTVFYRSTDGHLREVWWTGTWNGPADWTASAFGGAGGLSGAPSATVTTDGSQQLVFWQGGGGTLWEAWYAGGGWNGPADWSAG